MHRPKRISIGCYGVYSRGQLVVIQRMGRSGFKIVMRAGAKSPVFRRLRDAAVIAANAASPWPFEMPRPFDPVADLPPYLKRTRT